MSPVLVRGDGLAVEFIEAMLVDMPCTHRQRDRWRMAILLPPHINGDTTKILARARAQNLPVVVFHFGPPGSRFASKGATVEEHPFSVDLRPVRAALSHHLGAAHVCAPAQIRRLPWEVLSEPLTAALVSRGAQLGLSSAAMDLLGAVCLNPGRAAVCEVLEISHPAYSARRREVLRAAGMPPEQLVSEVRIEVEHILATLLHLRESWLPPDPSSRRSS